MRRGTSAILSGCFLLLAVTASTDLTYSPRRDIPLFRQLPQTSDNPQGFS